MCISVIFLATQRGV